MIVLDQYYERFYLPLGLVPVKVRSQEDFGLAGRVLLTAGTPQARTRVPDFPKVLSAQELTLTEDHLNSTAVGDSESAQVLRELWENDGYFKHGDRLWLLRLTRPNEDEHESLNEVDAMAIARFPEKGGALVD